MSTTSVRVPRTGWIAIGIAAAATANATGVGGDLAAVAIAVAGLAGLVAGAIGRGTPRGPWTPPVMAAGLGASLLALRLLVGPGALPPPPLPDDVGPWLGTVSSVGSPRDGRQVARVVLAGPQGDVAVAATLPVFPTVTAGTIVEVDGRLRPPPDDGYGEYLRRTGASGTLDVRSLRIVAIAPPSLQGVRDGAGDALQRALPEPEAGLAAGILIGLRERVDRALAADFSTAGVSHVVAISGWNIAIVAGLVGAVLRGRSRRLVTIAVLATVCAYVVAAGSSPSVVRAAVMAGVVLLARESGRAGRAPAALGAAAAVLLLLDPSLIEDAGFRLSVLATAGLLAWANPIADRLGRLGGGRIPSWLAESLGISLAAQAATLPDVLATFGRLSLVAPVVNLAVVPLIPVAMAGGVLALAGGAATTLGAPAIVATVAGLPGWLVLHVVVMLVRIGAAVPFAAVAIRPDLAPVAGMLGAAMLVTGPWLLHRAVAWRARTRRPSSATSVTSAAARRATPSRSPRHRAGLVAGAIVVAISAAALGDASGRTTRLTVLDVGQGDAILLETRSGARMLIDGGPDPERTLIALDERIPPWDRRLDVVVLTHPHEDHVAGLARVLERYTVGRAYEPGMRGPGPGWAAWDARLHDGAPRGILTTGARIRLGEVTLSVLWPDPGTVPLEPADTGTGINNVSIVFLGEANGTRFLLAGDIEQAIDPTLLARGLPPVDLLKVAHHGSATATTQAILDATRPRVAIASAGAGNPYGHPAPSTLSRLADSGARVYRTDRDGSVSVELKPGGLRVTTTGERRVARATANATTAAARAVVRQPGRASLVAGFTCAIPIQAGSPAWTPPLSNTPAAAAPPVAAPTVGPYGAPPATAWASPTGYDRGHDDPRSRRERDPAALARTTAVVPSTRLRRGRRRGVACGEHPGGRRHRRQVAGGGSGTAARRGQAAGCGCAGRAPPWRWVGGLAGGTRARGACARGPRPSGDPPRGAGVGGLAQGGIT